MTKRIDVDTIFKSNDPNKIIVFRAASLKDEIRFYLNDYQYISAKDNHNGGATIQYGEDSLESGENKKSALTIIKENFKDFLKFSIIMIIFATILALLSVALGVITNNVLFFLLSLHTLFFVSSIVILVILEYTYTPPALKSKHSAEHMMANFLENNKRLPINMEEFKKTTRFCHDCGSRKRVREIVQSFIEGIISAFLIIFLTSIMNKICNNLNVIIVLIITFVIYFGAIYVLRKLINYGILNFIVEPVLNITNNIIQCSNTTKKVEDNDILLAYLAAKYWMKVVHPEFYIEDDSFYNECIKS